KLAAATPTMPAPITPIVFFIAPSGHPGRSEAESRDPSSIPRRCGSRISLRASGMTRVRSWKRRRNGSLVVSSRDAQ
ncbi:MAG: hypothetical protein ACJ8C7_13510, partial [Microvirga sp.]